MGSKTLSYSHMDFYVWCYKTLDFKYKMCYTQNFTVMDYDFTDGVCREDGVFWG